MDWFTWLSKTSLDPSLIYEYGLAFVHNELEQEDLAHFTHDFLQSMGINTAKHRLEILKLAKKERDRVPHRMLRLVSKIKKHINKCVSKYILRRRRLAHQDSSLALVSRSEKGSSSRWKNVMLKRSGNTQGKSVLSQNSRHNHVICGDDSRIHSFSSPEVENENVGKQDSDDYWSSVKGVAEDSIRWDAMFDNLKPT
ncbi:hypothetical protein LIER_28493 [Lithospermum erythrorhizon]|uniref:SAM domain-containing protein n=1 Tax=Lithospermum erythrorhizon TaxID=34254 RepID=A0AAV3RJM3_LITER